MQSKKIYSKAFFLYLEKAGPPFHMNTDPIFNLQLLWVLSMLLAPNDDSVNYVYHK